MLYVALGLVLGSLSLIYLGLMERKVASAVDAMRAEIAQNTTVVQSAMALIDGLAAKIRGMANDPGGLQQLADELDANNRALAADIAANTAAADETPADAPVDTTGAAAGQDTLASADAADTASGDAGADTASADTSKSKKG